MLLSCQNYFETISYFYNERMNNEDCHITCYDQNVAFNFFLIFFKAFYDSTLTCSIVYKPTSCKVLS